MDVYNAAASNLNMHVNKIFKVTNHTHAQKFTISQTKLNYFRAKYAIGIKTKIYPKTVDDSTSFLNLKTEHN